MALVNGNEILIDARRNKYAVGAFNFTNLEQLKAIVEACESIKSNVIVQASASAIEYMGLETTVAMVKTLAEKSNIKICLNLDHGKDLDLIKNCIDAGFTNVMIDESDKTFEENVTLTKQVTEYAHKHGVTVESELGSLKGVEDSIVSKESLFTKPLDAQNFVEQTNIDSLAISIGTSHGAYKFKGESHLDIERLKQISCLVSIPLVLHGASSVSDELKAEFKLSGGEIGDAVGVSKQNLIDATKNGISKVNVDTDLRIAFTTGIRNTLKTSAEFNPRKYLTAGMEQMKKEIIVKANILNPNLKKR